MKWNGKGAVAAALVLAGALAYGAYLGSVPHLFLSVNERTENLGEAFAGKKIVLHYRHSVQQTHVWEYLEVNERRDGFVLTGTKYRSYGVGLPFLPTEGNYRSDGENFYLENMQRPYPEIQLRTGLGTELTVSTDERTLELYREYPPGTLIHLRVASLWHYYFNF